MRRALQVRVWSAAGLLAFSACHSSDPEPEPLKRDFGSFQSNVYPVLLRDCGFPTCHGAPERFFRVLGPGRVRVAGETRLPDAFDLPTGNEITTTYSLTLAMIDEGDLAHSSLLRKPLAVEAGGAGHLGVDDFGRDVYRTAQDSGYLTLARWVYNAPEPEDAGKPQPDAGAEKDAGRPNIPGFPRPGTMRDAGSPGSDAGAPMEMPDAGPQEPEAGVVDAGDTVDAAMPPLESPYRACANPSDCDPGAQCVITSNFPANATVCAPKCTDVGDCPQPEGSYDAELQCVSGYCRLDCTPVLFAPLLSCPADMVCVAPPFGAAYCHADES